MCTERIWDIPRCFPELLRALACRESDIRGVSAQIGPKSKLTLVYTGLYQNQGKSENMLDVGFFGKLTDTPPVLLRAIGTGNRIIRMPMRVALEEIEKIFL